MVVADECKIQREPNRFYRWSKKGQTPIIKVDRKKDDTGSFYAGLSYKDKTLTPYLTYARQTSHETCYFLDEIKKKYEGKGVVLLVWDGAKHHLGEVKDWLERNPGVVELFKFPPYCPDLNPQEHVWKALRAELATIVHTVTYKELIDHACRFLRTTSFDYDFGVAADLL